MGKDPSEIRREIEQTRLRMGDTVEALGYKADVPARVKDAVNDRVETVKGTINARVETVKETVGDVVESVRHTVTGAGGKVGKTLGVARESMRSGMSAANQRMSGSLVEMRGRMEEVGGRMSEMRGRVEEMRGQMSEQMNQQMGEQMGALNERIPSPPDVGGMARRGAGIAAENPLGLALGAMALGFLIGLLIPTTEYERERIGPLRDDLLERGKTLSGGVVGHGRAVLQETAQATVAAAQQSVQQHGSQVLAGGLEPQTLMSNAIAHGKAVLRETADVAMRTAQQSVEEHRKHVMEGVPAAMERDSLELDRSRMPRDSGPARGTGSRSGMPGDIGDTAPAAGMPSDASQGGGLRAGTKLAGGTAAQTPQDTGETSSQYGRLEPGSP